MTIQLSEEQVFVGAQGQHAGQALRSSSEIINSQYERVALQYREPRFRRMFETAPDAMILIHRDGTLAFANQRAEQLFGYSRAELLNLKLEKLLPQGFRREHGRYLRKYSTATKARPTKNILELYGLGKNGREFPVEVSLSALELEEGWLVFCTFRDITKRKQIEDDLRQALHQVATLKDQLEVENVYLRTELHSSHGFEDIIGESDALQRVLYQVEQVAATGSSVLILGETGTGKELIARAIHGRGPRRERSLVKVDCSALPPSLIESELFGHEKGAFTNALSRKIGRFEVAKDGTLFLDEIGDLPLELQVKLLRLLQDGEFERLGSIRTLKVDVRIIAATNRDLDRAVAEGRFRADLYYRLGVFPIELPPLRQRREDIPLLTRHFITKHQGKLGKQIERIPAETMKALVAYHWPGNVRELANVIERAVILTSGSTLRLDLPSARAGVSPEQRPSSQALEDVERAHILDVLKDCGWKVSGHGNAAERLGMNRSTLRYRIRKLGLERP